MANLHMEVCTVTGISLPQFKCWLNYCAFSDEIRRKNFRLKNYTSPKSQVSSQFVLGGVDRKYLLPHLVSCACMFVMSGLFVCLV